MQPDAGLGADLAEVEAAAHGAERRAWEVEVRDRTAAELAGVRLVDRLRGAGDPITVWLPGWPPLTGTVADGGAGWIRLRTSLVEQAIVSLSCATAIDGAGWRVAPSTGVADRLPLSTVLRDLWAAEVPVRLLLPGAAVDGVLAAVAADHLDVRRSAIGRARVLGRGLDQPPGGLAGTRITVPFAALIAVLVGSDAVDQSRSAASAARSSGSSSGSPSAARGRDSTKARVSAYFRWM